LWHAENRPMNEIAAMAVGYQDPAAAHERQDFVEVACRHRTDERQMMSETIDDLSSVASILTSEGCEIFLHQAETLDDACRHRHLVSLTIALELLDRQFRYKEFDVLMTYKFGQWSRCHDARWWGTVRWCSQLCRHVRSAWA